MTFRGYFTLNGVEIANSSRVVAHSGIEPPTSDVGILGGTADCSLTPVADHPLLGVVPADSVPIAVDSLLYTPPNGSRLYSRGLALIGDCWDDTHLCIACQSFIEYDDSWDGLAAFLGEVITYRPELAPWYSTQAPESTEFGGIWLLDVKGLDVPPVQVEITELVGDGGVPMPPRNTSRKVTFDALLVACTSAGVDYGLKWLAAQLRTANSIPGYGVLGYLAAHPGHSAVDPTSLLREVRGGVVMTVAPTIQASVNAARNQNQQATIYRVSWELTLTQPNVYLPAVTLAVDWDSVTSEPIKWVHAIDCGIERSGCDLNPKIYAEGCAPVIITETVIPPPTCGGCIPVCAVETSIFAIPSANYPVISRETALSLVVTNTDADPTNNLTLQGYFRRCNTDDQCALGREMWPFQLTGVAPGVELTLDAITGRASAFSHGRTRQPIGIVSTPSGAPWLPIIMDRSVCWELVTLTSGATDFTVNIILSDREA